MISRDSPTSTFEHERVAENIEASATDNSIEGNNSNIDTSVTFVSNHRQSESIIEFRPLNKTKSKFLSHSDLVQFY